MEKAQKSIKFKKWVTIVIYAVAIPAVILIGALLISAKLYNIVSIAVALLACVPFFVGFEKAKTGARELVVIAVMTAISVVGRMIFMPTPHFKPVTAIVVIAGIAFGAQSGFIVGALSALVSNIYFGQGPWTPFQMFAWGFLGLLAGLLFKNTKKPNMVVLTVVGLLGGVLYSMMMDIYTVLQAEQGFNMLRYLGALITGWPVMLEYSVSNVVFLLLLTRPILSKLNRVKTKFGLFGYVSPPPEQSSSQEQSPQPEQSEQSQPQIPQEQSEQSSK